MMASFKSFSFLCFIMSFSISIYAGNTNDRKGSLIILNNPEEQYNPALQTRLFEDKSGNLQFPQILARTSSFSKNHEGTINMGITSSVLWCMLTIKNQSDENWFIQIGEPYIDIIDLYSVDSKGNIQVIESGLIRAQKKASIRVNHYILPLNLKLNEEKTFYIRAKSTTILKLPLVINSIQNHFEVNHKGDLINGIYFGFIFALSLYNLFVFLLLKDKTYLFYVFYINCLGATIAWLRGYSPEFFNTVPQNINHGNNFSALTFIFLILFTHFFLNLKKIFPAHKWLIALFSVFSIVAVTLTILGQYHYGFYFVLFIIIANVPYIAFFGIYALKKGFRPAVFYLLGFTFFTLGDGIFILSENAQISQTLLGNYSLQIGSALEAIVLSFALAHKLNNYKKEKEETQARALAQANAFSIKLIQTQEEERKRIAGELHDSIGQSLSLIKNRIAILHRNSSNPDTLHELNEMVANTIQEIRSITYGLRPFQLDLLGLTQSLKSLTESFSESGEIKFESNIENIDGKVSKNEEIYIFRILQECLNNISKHSQASEALVKINQPNGKIHILIEDNGKGIEENLNGGYGLIGIKERLSILNGTMEIVSNQPKGTRIIIQIGS